MTGEGILLLFVAAIAVFVLVVLARAIRIVPQQQQYIIERLGRFNKTLYPGLNVLVPFIEAVREKVDMREQVVSFRPQSVITSDNLVVSIDTVLYFQVTDSARATYEIANVLQGIEELTTTTLRNVIGSMDLERTLTSREEINRQLRTVLDEATGKWGIRVNRVELKAIEPPPSVRDSMEKQMRAERDRRAAILQAEGHKQSQILSAEGEKQSAVLSAQGEREAAILKAEGEAKAVRTVADAIHRANPDPKMLAYQYVQALPQIAQGQASTMWVIPSEITRALDGLNTALGRLDSQPTEATPTEDSQEIERFAAEARATAQAAQQEAENAVRQAQDAVENRRQAPMAGQSGSAESTAATGEQTGQSGQASADQESESTAALPPSPPAPASSVVPPGAADPVHQQPPPEQHYQQPGAESGPGQQSQSGPHSGGAGQRWPSTGWQ